MPTFSASYIPFKQLQLTNQIILFQACSISYSHPLPSIVSETKCNCDIIFLLNAFHYQFSLSLLMPFFSMIPRKRNQFKMSQFLFHYSLIHISLLLKWQVNIISYNSEILCHMLFQDNQSLVALRNPTFTIFH